MSRLSVHRHLLDSREENADPNKFECEDCRLWSRRMLDMVAPSLWRYETETKVETLEDGVEPGLRLGEGDDLNSSLFPIENVFDLVAASALDKHESC